MTGYVRFRLGDRGFVTALDEVREIVRFTGLEALPGTEPPLAGVIVLRGAPLPVFDVRATPDTEAESGDVLVVEAGGDSIGIVVDQVLAVLGGDDLQEGDAPAKALPPYVVGVRSDASGPVLLVDLHRLLDVTRDGWRTAVVGAQA